MSDGRPVDRRGQARAGVPGKARIVLAPGETAELAIRDLSVDGARLVGHVQLHEGDMIAAELELHDGMLSLVAEVVRVDAQHAQLAIAFRNITAEARETIQRAVQAMIDRVRTVSSPAVIVLHADSEIRAALERDLAQLGRPARACAALVEATWALADASQRYGAIIIGGDLDPAAISALLRHVADEHRGMRRIVLFGDQLGAIDKASSALVDAMLRQPVRIRALARALGIMDTDSSMALILPSDD